MHRFNVLRKVLAIGELELFLVALLDGDRRKIALADRITENGGPKFLVHQDASAILWRLIHQSLLKACIDDLLTVCNGDHLLRVQRFFPAEEAGDVGRAMVER